MDVVARRGFAMMTHGSSKRNWCYKDQYTIPGQEGEDFVEEKDQDTVTRAEAMAGGTKAGIK